MVWGTERVAGVLKESGVFPYVPVRQQMYGNPEIIFGTSETNIQGTMVTSGTIIVSIVYDIKEYMLDI